MATATAASTRCATPWRRLGLKAHIASYSEHAMTGGSDSSAMAYVGVEDPGGKIIWGAGEHHDIITASIKASFLP